MIPPRGPKSRPRTPLEEHVSYWVALGVPEHRARLTFAAEERARAEAAARQRAEVEARRAGRQKKDEG